MKVEIPFISVNIFCQALSERVELLNFVHHKKSCPK